jgi:hypothetical protein
MRNLLACLLLFPAALNSQTFQAHYGTAGNDDAYSIALTPGNGLVLCGSSSNAGQKNALVINTLPGGLLQWAKTYGGSGDETAMNVKPLTQENGFIFCGETFSADPAGDGFIAKIDSAGNLAWWKNTGGPGYDVLYAVRPLGDGGFITAGLIQTGPADYDALMLRLDANGDTLWSRVLGGPGIDHAVQIIATADSGFLFCGKILSYGAGSCDNWLVKMDAAGDTLWTSIIGGAGWDEAMDVVEVPGGFTLCGATTTSGGGMYDFMLMHVDQSGALQWAKTYGGDHIEASYNIQQVANGYIFAGYTETYGPGHNRGTDSANVLLIRTDTFGDTLWSMAYGGNKKEECFSLAVMPGGFAVTGYTGSFGDSLDAYIFRTDTAGISGCNEKRAYPQVGIPPFATMRHTVNVQSVPNAYSPAIAQFNGNLAANEICGGPLGIPPLHEETTVIFPNPAHGQLNVKCTEQSDITLYDSFGKCVRTWNDVTAEVLDVRGIAAGIYLLKIENADGAFETLKVFIE